MAAFRKLVQQHNNWGNRVDRTKFPPLRGGYYEFRNLGDLTNRLQISRVALSTGGRAKSDFLSVPCYLSPFTFTFTFIVFDAIHVMRSILRRRGIPVK